MNDGTHIRVIRQENNRHDFRITVAPTLGPAFYITLNLGDAERLRDQLIELLPVRQTSK